MCLSQASMMQLTVVLSLNRHWKCLITTQRHLSDRLKRRPMRVFTSDEADRLQKSRGKIEDQASSDTWDQGVSAFHTDDILPPGMKFEKLHEFDKRLAPVMNTLNNRKIRERKDIVLLEGVRLIKDAMRVGANIKAIYFTKLELLKDFPWNEKDVKLYKLKQAHMKLWSDMGTPPGVVAITETPKEAHLAYSTKEDLPLTLICDNIRDPGNMGTLLRLAAAAGCQRVIASKGCVDVWEPKVIRAATGSHFCLNILKNIEWQHMVNYISKDSRVYLADNNATHDSTPLLDLPQPDILTEVDDQSSSPHLVDDSYTDKDNINLYKNAPLTLTSIWNTKFSPANETVVVIGGETHGLSSAARKLAYDYHGERLHIPINSKMESLNAATAAAVILFEIRKQLTTSLH